MSTDNDLEEKKVSFLKRFAAEPCVRQTYLYSFTGGLVVGSLSFMFTSHVRKSIARGFGMFGATMGVYWIYCRYNYFKEQEQLKKISEILASKALELGSQPNDPIISEFKK
uniref:Cytochrome c oxidase assembly protein COX20, mitochondrial n=1 Tax=Tetranychus urticae TaxID=32264 RepID=T1KXV8_TETUR